MADADIEMSDDIASTSSTSIKDKKRFEVKKVNFTNHICILVIYLFIYIYIIYIYIYI